MNVSFDFDEVNYKRAENFFKFYEFESIIGDSESDFFLGTKTNPQTCRFCNRSAPEVSFEMEAHVMPQFMGNKHLLSYFECDDCNHLFSKYEDSFANFFGVGRTFAQIKGQNNKIPKFKDPKSGLEVKVGETAIELSFIEGFNPVNIDESNKSLKVTTKKAGFIPIHILKIIVKMALCMLSDDEMTSHQTARRFVRESDKNEKYKDQMILRLFSYFIPGPTYYNSPYVQLYKLKDEHKDAILPTRHIVLMYGNFQFQMVLPYADIDRRLIGTKPDLPIIPLLVNKSHFEKFGKYQFFITDYTSNEKQSSGEQVISFSFDSLQFFEPTDPTAE